MKKFWVCWIVNNEKPLKQYASFIEAKEEAVWLSQKEKSKVFILECIGYFQQKETPVEYVPITGYITN